MNGESRTNLIMSLILFYFRLIWRFSYLRNAEKVVINLAIRKLLRIVTFIITMQLLFKIFTNKFIFLKVKINKQIFNIDIFLFS